MFGALYLYKAGQPCYSRFAAALFSLTTLMLPLALGLCCAVCTIRLWLYVGLEPITVVLQNFLFSVCRGARGEYFPSLLYYQKDQITAFFFLVLLPQWTVEHEFCMLSKGFPFPHEFRTLPVGMSITVCASVLQFILDLSDILE